MRSLPRHVVHHMEVFSSLRGRICFAIKGEGAWVVHLGNLQRPVEVGQQPADLHLGMTKEAFAGLIDGTLDVLSALESGDVSGRGDFSLLVRLGMFLTPPATGLQVRMGRSSHQ